MKFFLHYLTISLVYFCFLSTVYAVDFGNSDESSLGLGTFNNSILATCMQADEKILVGGNFTYYETTPINRLVRLNTDGSIDNSFLLESGMNNSVTTIALQADGKILVGGNFTTFNGASQNYLIRLNADGTKDNDFNIGTGANNNIRSIAIQSDGKILIGGDFTVFNGISKNRLVRLTTDGTVDNTFDVGSGANAYIATIVLQSDGKILIGGEFTSFNGVNQNSLIRLTADGAIDTTLNIGTGPGSSYNVNTLSIQDDNKILVGGFFSSFNGVARKCLVRLNTDGSVDNTFAIGTGANIGAVFSIAIQSNGNILVGGDFTAFNNFSSNRLVCLYTDGSINNAFDIGLGANSRVSSISIQTDDKLIVGGSFSTFHESLSSSIVRLNTSGLVDATFNNQGQGANSATNHIALQADGKILVGGSFTTFNAVSKKYLVRLNKDGSIDNTFNIGAGPNNTVNAICIQSDGKILVGGDFTLFNGVSQSYIVRLLSDGSIDNTFNVGSGANKVVHSIAIQQDGQIVIGGDFTAFNSFSQGGLIRLYPNGTIDPTLYIGTGISSSRASSGLILSIIIQKDNKILIGGNFDTYNGNSSKSYFLRLNADGSIDDTFEIGTGANGGITSIVLQDDGKILLAGGINRFNGGPSVNYLFRINPDGSVDNTFNIGSGANYLGVIATLAVQQDGKIIAGGWFTSFNGVAKNHIVRLNTDGSIDPLFNVGSGSNACVAFVLFQPDGNLLAGGAFTQYNELKRNHIVRIKAYVPEMLFISKNTEFLTKEAKSSSTIDVISNTTWSISSDQSWLVVTPHSSSNNETITFTSEENTGPIRTAVVTITSSYVTQVITVTQESGIATGITSINNDIFKLYPNPAKSSFCIHVHKPASVLIYNLHGVLVLTKTVNSEEPIETNTLVTGLYIVSIKTDDTVVTRNLIIE
jgi:uncharacterized delta-60 repeat protein